MSNPIPDLLALTSIADGSQRLASPLRNNYAAVQAAVNALITALSGGAAGQRLQAVDSTDVQWSYQGGLYRKTTSKQVVNTVAETDLLNGEVTIGAGVMGASGAVRLVATGDLVNNTGISQTPPRFKLKLGATTLIDTNVPAANMGSVVNRLPWRIDALIQNLGLTNSQWATFRLQAYMANPIGNNVVGVVAGEGLTFLESINGGFGEMHSLVDNSSVVDTTVAQALALTVINGAANAAYDVTLKSAVVEVI